MITSFLGVRTRRSDSLHASDGCTRKNWDFHGAEGGQDHAPTEVTSVSQKPCKGQKGWMAFFCELGWFDQGYVSGAFCTMNAN